MTRAYQVAGRRDSRKLAEFLSKEGQLLLPMLDRITQAEMAVDELIDAAGRATIEAILLMSAQDVAGVRHPGKACGAFSLPSAQVCCMIVNTKLCQPGLFTAPSLRQRQEPSGPSMGASEGREGREQQIAADRPLTPMAPRGARTAALSGSSLP